MKAIPYKRVTSDRAAALSACKQSRINASHVHAPNETVAAGPGLVPRPRRSDHLADDSQPFRAGLTLAGRPSGPRDRMRSLLRFSCAGTHEVLALPALKPDFLYAALDATAYAGFVKESRKKRAEPPSCTGNPGKRVIRVETLSRSTKALLPPHKCGGSHQQF
jgi:hypothetical protein